MTHPPVLFPMCTHESTFSIGGKTADRCSWTFPDGKRGDGYVPHIRGIGGGDYIRITVCMECKQVVGFMPEDVLEAQTGEEEEE